VFATNARLVRDQNAVRELVKTAFKPLADDIMVLSARGEAKLVIERLGKLLVNLQ